MSGTDAEYGGPPYDGASQTVKRQTGTTSFPYANLEDVVTIAKAMHDAGGVPMSSDQIANCLGVSDNSTLGVKLGSAKQFGVILAADGRLLLTDLGNRLISADESDAQRARHEAFLNVEIYKKAFEHFRGKNLPSKSGIENAFVSWGVAEKQKDKARWAFERSAAFAGFYNSAKDRLVAPLLLPGSPQLPPQIAEGNGSSIGKSPATAVGTIAPKPIVPFEHSLIKGMLELLPTLGSKWGAKERARWLRRLSHNLAAIYDAEDDTEIDIIVVMGKDPG